MPTKSNTNLINEVKHFKKAHPDVDQVELLATDFPGNFFSKRFPIDKLEDMAANGLTIPRAMYVLTTVSDTVPEYVNMGLEDGDPDFNVRIVPSSLSLNSWGNRPRAQALMTSAEPEHPVDPRQILVQVLEKFQATGLNPVAAFELEFTLLDNDRADDGDIITVNNPKTGEADKTIMLGAERLDGFEDILDEIVKNCASQNIGTSTICAEYGAGQFEINFPHYDNVLDAADHAQLFKRTVKSVARKHGVRASFIAKPGLKRPGNGQHVHISVLDDNGRNIFDGGDKASDQLMHAIGGMVACAPESMLYWAPNINSYRRFEPENCVPTGATWAHESRMVGFRIPIATNGAWRIENRLPGADANCYLVLASMLGGILSGLESKLDPGTETQGAPGIGVDSLPLNMRDAIDAARSGNRLKPILGEEFVTLFSGHREGELHQFEKYISSRELDWYL